MRELDALDRALLEQMQAGVPLAPQRTARTRTTARTSRVCRITVVLRRKPTPASRQRASPSMAVSTAPGTPRIASCREAVEPSMLTEMRLTPASMRLPTASAVSSVPLGETATRSPRRVPWAAMS